MLLSSASLRDGLRSKTRNPSRSAHFKRRFCEKQPTEHAHDFISPLLPSSGTNGKIIVASSQIISLTKQLIELQKESTPNIKTNYNECTSLYANVKWYQMMDYHHNKAYEMC